ncbi:MAG: hypothetical protein KGL52_17030 [Rhodospirillales bacterium]|nr:hypothetical protein [Rhodospirillales bacterium]
MDAGTSVGAPGTSAVVDADAPAAATADARVARGLADTAEAVEAELEGAIAAFRAQSARAADHGMAIASRTVSVATEARATAATVAAASHSVSAVAQAGDALAVGEQEIASQVGQAATLIGGAVAEAAQTVEVVAELDRSAEAIGAIVRLISDIAGQVNLLALNATIEAARAGEAGRGFTVVATEVKQLARRTAEATQDIQRQIAAVQQAARAGTGSMRRIDAAIRGIAEVNAMVTAATREQEVTVADLARRLREAATGVTTMAGAVETITTGIAEIAQLSAAVNTEVTANARQIEQLRGNVMIGLRRSTAVVAADAEQRVPVALGARLSMGGLEDAGVIALELAPACAIVRLPAEADPHAVTEGATGRFALLDAPAGEDVAATCLAAEAGRLLLRLDPPVGRTEPPMAALVARIRARDQVFAEGARRFARRIGAAIDADIAAGGCTEADAFDTDYRRIEGSDPAQYMTRFTLHADRIIRPLLDEAQGVDQAVIGVFLVDRNGYAPTHNTKSSEPQRPGDPLWNALHSRNRWLFNDRAGIAAGRSTRAVLAQCYERNMGGGKTAIIKEADSPIMVGGRHWGAVRIMHQP